MLIVIFQGNIGSLDMDVITAQITFLLPAKEVVPETTTDIPSPLSEPVADTDGVITESGDAVKADQGAVVSTSDSLADRINTDLTLSDTGVGVEGGPTAAEEQTLQTNTDIEIADTKPHIDNIEPVSEMVQTPGDSEQSSVDSVRNVVESTAQSEAVNSSTGSETGIQGGPPLSDT